MNPQNSDIDFGQIVYTLVLIWNVLNWAENVSRVTWCSYLVYTVFVIKETFHILVFSRNSNQAMVFCRNCEHLMLRWYYIGHTPLHFMLWILNKIHAFILLINSWTTGMQLPIVMIRKLFIEGAQPQHN